MANWLEIRQMPWGTKDRGSQTSQAPEYRRKYVYVLNWALEAEKHTREGVWTGVDGVVDEVARDDDNLGAVGSLCQSIHIDVAMC